MGDQPIEVGTRVTFPYGTTRRTGRIAESSLLPNGKGGMTTAYLIDVGSGKVFVQGGDVTPVGEGTATAFDPVAEGVAYGRKKPRGNRR